MFFSKKSYTVSIPGRNITLEVKSGTNLYKLLIDENLINPTLCNGAGQCGKCKMRYLSPNPPKPVYKETLILAKVNIDAGYRLACQQVIKKNIEIDISEISSPAKFFNTENKTEVKKDEAEENNVEENIQDTAEEIPVFQEEIDETVSINDFSPEQNNKSSFDIRKEEGPTDGILLIQQRSGIRYYCYSAAIDNIVSEGTHPYNEPLRDIIDNDMLPDFLYSELKIRDIERVMVLIEGNDSYGAETKMDMFRYLNFEIGTQQYEMIMPRGSKSYDITHFFRLLNADNANQLIFSLDMLNRCHYATPKLFTDMHFPFLRNNNLVAVKPRGLNPITSFNEKLEPATVESKEKDIDGITLTALLQFVKLMLKNGIINNKFQLRPRSELAKQNVPLGMSVRVYGQETPEGYYIYRDRFAEIVITQSELNELYQIRSYIRSVIDYTRECIGVVDGLIFYTTQTHDDLINLMVDLEFIPKEFANKVIYRPGEATVQAIKLFKEKDVPTFLQVHFNNIKRIDLLDDADFQKAAVSNFLEI